MEKESITIEIEAKRYDSGNNLVFRDKYLLALDAHREEISKKIREFVEDLENSFEH